MIRIATKYKLAALVLAIALVATFDAWLVTCGFESCPTAQDIRSFRPNEGGRIFDRNGRLIGRLAVVRRVNVPLSAVPQRVRDAFIATEDRRFYSHNGLDWRAVFRATLRNIRSGGVREGFSTITMQVVRNAFVVRRLGDRSVGSKLIELRLSRLLERNLTKNQILELYLNIIYMGNGVYGVEAASRDLFGRSVGQISTAEAAMLAALPKAPSVYTPRRNPVRALARRNLVLELMAREGYISAAQLATLRATPVRIAREQWRPDQSFDSFAIDAVRRVADSVIRSGSLDVNDLTAYTTLDIRAQLAADRAVRRRAAAIQEESYARNGQRVEGAMVALDPRTGDIRAIVGGRRYERGSFDRALLARRQPGSAFKPFVYATALAAGFTPASEVDDNPVEVVQGRTVWAPRNFGDEYLGNITFRRALIRSSNAAAVRVSQMVGIPSVIATARRNGITSNLPVVPAVALGAVDVTPLELVTAYAPFANGGVRVQPRLVRRLEASDGAILWSSDTQRTRVMQPADAYQLTSMLRSVVDYGTGRAVRDYGVRGPVAGKTGTTNNGADVWFVGYTPTLVAGFWFGYDDPRPVSGDASGGRLAAPAWAEFYTTGWSEPPGQAASTPPWSPPPGLTPVTIDATTGWIASEWCPVTQRDWYKPGTEPGRICPVHGPPELAVPNDSGLPGEIPKQVKKGADKITKFFRRLFKF